MERKPRLKPPDRQPEVAETYTKRGVVGRPIKLMRPVILSQSFFTAGRNRTRKAHR